MSEKHLHIVSFDIPWPANYGGVIDVFYKIKALFKQGIKVHLHCIEYPGRDRASELNKYCKTVNYYPRKTGLRSALSIKPYIVQSRRSEEMMHNLLKDNYPILFEGLHSCYYINDPRIRKRFKIYRESNIEHKYYFNLFKVCINPFNKLYFLFASCKLRRYQRVLKNANLMLAVSKKDTEYLQDHFPANKVEYLPSFHANEELEILPGKGNYALYHGNIEVPENAHAAAYLIKEVFNDIDYPLIIAGMNPPKNIQRLIEGREHITLVKNPDDTEMFRLIREAQMNILVTFQATGLKLKLLNTLYQGRHCLVNDKMLNGTMLNELCLIANTTESLKKEILDNANIEFDQTKVDDRKLKLNSMYSNERNADKLISFIH